MIRNTSRRLTNCLLAIFVLFGSAMGAAGPTRAQGEIAAAGALVKIIKDIIRDLDNSASALMQQGNVYAANQQQLISGILRSTIEQIERSAGRTIDKAAWDVDVVTFNALQRLSDLALQVRSNLRNDLSDLIWKSQSAANQVLDRLPLTKQAPTVHGIAVRDFLISPDASANDITILGFWLSAPAGATSMKIEVNGNNIPSERITRYFDRIEVSLPEDVKRLLAFANEPCEPRKPIRLSVEIPYFIDRGLGFWPFKWKSLDTRIDNFLVSAGQQQFNVATAVSGVRRRTQPVIRQFRAESPNFNWGCEQNAANSATFSLPPNASIIGSPSSGWAELGGRWENHQCTNAVAGSTVSGTCSVRGGNKECFVVGCNCAGGGHGRVAVWGNYSVPETQEARFDNELLQTSTILGWGAASMGLPAANGDEPSRLIVKIKRANRKGICNQIFDAIDLPITPRQGDAAPRTVARATSKDGQFLAVVDHSTVTITRLTLGSNP